MPNFSSLAGLEVPSRSCCMSRNLYKYGSNSLNIHIMHVHVFGHVRQISKTMFVEVSQYEIAYGMEVLPQVVALLLVLLGGQLSMRLLGTISIIIFPFLLVLFLFCLFLWPLPGAAGRNCHNVKISVCHSLCHCVCHVTSIVVENIIVIEVEVDELHEDKILSRPSTSMTISTLAHENKKNNESPS